MSVSDPIDARPRPEDTRIKASRAEIDSLRNLVREASGIADLSEDTEADVDELLAHLETAREAIEEEIDAGWSGVSRVEKRERWLVVAAELPDLAERVGDAIEPYVPEYRVMMDEDADTRADVVESHVEPLVADPYDR